MKKKQRLQISLPPFQPPKTVMRKAWLCRDTKGSMVLWLGKRSEICKRTGGHWDMVDTMFNGNSLWIDVAEPDGNDCYWSEKGHLIPGPYPEPGECVCVDLEMEEDE